MEILSEFDSREFYDDSNSRITLVIPQPEILSDLDGWSDPIGPDIGFMDLGMQEPESFTLIYPQAR
jgi:hypothetical protein